MGGDEEAGRCVGRVSVDGAGHDDKNDVGVGGRTRIYTRIYRKLGM